MATMPTQRTTTISATATLMLLTAGTALAQSTIKVPADAPTIQAAIDRAASGDTILVAAGEYRERLTVGDLALTIRGEDGAASTTIDGSAQPGFVVTVATVGGQLTLEGVTITGGRNDRDLRVDGGAIRAEDASVALVDVVLTGNSGVEAAGVSALRSTVRSSGSSFLGGAMGDGPGDRGRALYVLGGEVILDGDRFEGFTGTGLGGAIYIAHADVDIRNIEAVDNGVVEFFPGYEVYQTLGGGAIYTTGVNGRIDASRFVGNAAAFGGALYIAGTGTLEVTNSLIVDSQAANGTIYTNASAPIFVNCTVANNGNWGVFAQRESRPVVRNSVFTGNQVLPASIEIGGPGIVDVAYSIIDGDSAATIGEGVLFADPQLDDSFALLPGSPAIDAGDNAAVPGGITTDLLGAARFVDDPTTPDTGAGAAPIVDMGAIEFWPGDAAACAADMDGDRELTLLDFLAFQNAFDAGEAIADFDGDGSLTIFDFLAFQSAFDAGC